MKVKKKFTVEDVLKFNPCEYYTRERIEELFKSVDCKKYMSIEKLFQVDIPVEDFFWLILREEFISERTLHEFAIWCTESVLHIWEKKYPEDKRLHEVIRIKKLWIDGEATDEELSAAAAWAAAAATWADAARDAAVRAATWAAAAAGNAAAAWDAAVAGNAAARGKQKEKLKEMIL